MKSQALKRLFTSSVKPSLSLLYNTTEKACYGYGGVELHGLFRVKALSNLHVTVAWRAEKTQNNATLLKEKQRPRCIR